MDEGFYASAEKLELHKAINRRELELARELVSHLERIGTLLTQPDDRYRLLLAQAVRIEDSFRKLNQFTDDFENRVFVTSRQINERLKKAGEGLRTDTAVFPE